MELTEDDILQNLLTQVSSISKKYEDIANITGENFNIFKVLKVESSEVRLHSALIAELLNPKGSHGQGDSFLKFFNKRFQIEDFDTTNSTMEVEKFIGWINEDVSEGGRIDIVLSPLKGRKVFIENKIYAGDQVNQLYRYHKFDPDAYLLYLTLDGKEPSKESKGSLNNEDFQCISYENDIIEWLKECNKEAVNHPLLRETITQYINLIKYLTHQTINDNMQTDLVNSIVNKPENIKAAFSIAGSIRQIQKGIMDKFYEALTSDFKNTDTIIGYEIFDEEGGGLTIYVTIADWKDYFIEIDLYYDGDYHIGIRKNKDSAESAQQDYKDLSDKVRVKLEGISSLTRLDFPGWIWVNRNNEYWHSGDWSEKVTLTNKTCIMVKQIITIIKESGLKL